ncbi:ATP-binding protein [Novosphingobium sp.]|uniref:ATP-binding protein n=1 Tax=Novosphingobium sp. TaxID=1874826 RepID=UPI0025F2944B|nr:ATP-binding protein [Novosphingobium sp.]
MVITDKARRPFSVAFEIAAMAAVFFVMAVISLAIARGEGRVAALWLPNAVMFIWLMWRPALARLDTFLVTWAANTAAGLLFGDDLFLAGVLALSNMVEVSVALALAWRAGVKISNLGTLEQQLRLFACSGILSPAISAAIASIALGLSIGERAAPIWLSWFVTDSLGMMLVASTLGVILQHANKPRRITRREIAEWSVLTVVGTSVTLSVFAQSKFPLLFLVTPVVIIHAVRHGLMGTAVSTLKIAIIAVSATVLGRGPIMLTPDPWMRIVILQLFLVSIFMMGIPIAALLRRQQRTADSLIDREAQFSMLAASMSDAVLAFDAQGRCTFSAGSAHQLLAMPSDRIVGSYVSDLVEAADRPRFEGAIDRILARSSFAETVTYRSPRSYNENFETFIEAKLAPTVDASHSRKLVIIATLRDVTDRVALERELVDARERAELAVLAKSQFLANMSHEIRTPMNGVLGFAELLEQQLTEPEQRRRAKLIVESGQSMMHLLNDILDLSKAEVGLVTICEEPMDLRGVIEECISLNSAQAANKSISLKMAIAPSLPPKVWCDPLRLRQIVLNLLGNAIKFTDEGCVTLSVAEIGSRLRILIRDTGVGIPRDRLHAIFQPFEQADNATSRRFGGTGLGLTISRQLAELMDGSLEVTSELGKGSCFALDLPLRAVDVSHGNGPLISPNAATQHGSARRSHILLVDDQEINRELAKAMLEQLGQTVSLVTNGEEAVAAVIASKADGALYDLVFMDIQMPVCDGYQATRAIRNSGVMPHSLPIVAMTANAYPEDVRMALDNGMQDHLAKPITLARLDALLVRWLIERPQEMPSGEATFIDDQRMAQMWQDTRSIALIKAQDWLECGHAHPEITRGLQDCMHRIAGTALHFGEGPFGQAAATVDRAIERGAPDPELQTAVRLLLIVARGEEEPEQAESRLRKIA